jgi:KUP system potassium uptake protein
MLTPAISVLSAVEGLGVVSHAFHPFILPISLAILVGLFVIQSHGTERMGQMFGPVMLIYFLSIAAMGVANIRMHPQVLWEPLNPLYIFYFFKAHPFCPSCRSPRWSIRSPASRRSMPIWAISGARRSVGPG